MKPPPLPPPPGGVSNGSGQLVPVKRGVSYRPEPVAGNFVVPDDDRDVMPMGESPQERRERIRRQNLSECRSICLFFVFLGFFTALILLEQSASSSRLADHIRAKLEPGQGTVSLESVYDIPSLYEYLAEVLVPAVYENSTDTNMAVSHTDMLNLLDLSNRILGGVRLRQVRVQHVDDCQVGPLFGDWNVQCYPSFTGEVESRESFGLDGKYQYSSDDRGSGWTGQLGSYNAHGFMAVLPQNGTLALNKIAEMRADEFLGAATRAFFIDFSVWNANVGTYAVATLVTEFGASGGVRTNVRILTMPQRALVPGGLGNTTDWMILFLMAVVTLFIIWFVFEEIQEIWSRRLSYLTDFWNILDWVNMILLLYGFVLRVLLFSEASGSKLGSEALLNAESFQNLEGLAERVELIKLYNAFNTLLLWGKVVKYLRFFPYIKNMIRAVWDAFDLFLPFLLMFGVAFIGFTMAYNIGFGDKLYELSTFGRAFIYLCRAFLRDVKLMPVYQITPMFGAILILIFYVSMVLVGVNVIFAILADAIFRAKYPKDYRQKSSAKEKYEDEPLQELWREITMRWRRFLKAKIPWLYKRLYKKKRGKVRTAKAWDADGAAEGNGNGGAQVIGNALQDQESEGRPSKLVRLQDARHGGSSQKSSRMGALDDGMSDSDYSVAAEEVALPTREELMRTIEHMSGRILSEVSIVGIEIKSELHDVCERVAQMQMAVDELATRVEEVRVEQEANGIIGA